MEQNLIKQLIKDKNVASIAPTSKSIVKALCKKIEFNKKIIIVEYGPGTGVFTKYLLENMTPNSKLIVIETNQDFVKKLNEINDKRLVVVNDNAKNIKNAMEKCNEKKADYIISGIPLLFFDSKLIKSIIEDTEQSLDKNGKFLVYQTSPILNKHLKNYFHVEKCKLKLFNIPPLFIFEFKKNNS